MRRHFAGTLLIMLALALTGEAAGFRGPVANHPVYASPGIGIEGVAINYSTMDSVVANYGKDFALVEHNKYSFEMSYEELGLSFWYRYEDPEKRIFCIALKPASHAFTSRGIIVGKSRLRDVVASYGRSRFLTTSANATWFFAYPGVEFHVEYDRDRDPEGWTPEKILNRKVIAIEIQCEESNWPPKASNQRLERTETPMFDTFDIIVPKLTDWPGLTVVPHETVFGRTDVTSVYVKNIRIGRTVPARVAFSAIEAWTGSLDRADWDVILLEAEANAASNYDGAWAEFLTAVREFLVHQPKWRVTCESDCDQYPTPELALTADSLIELLDSYRRTNHFPIAFFSESRP